MLAQLRALPDLIAATLEYEHRLRDGFEQSKAVVQLVDGTYMHLNEVWIDGVLRKYAYYLLTPTSEVICGWDNAPHHPEVSTYPHHLHRDGAVHPSEVRSLTDVFEILLQDFSGQESNNR